LNTARKGQRKAIIATASKEQLHTLFEVIHTILYGKLPLNVTYIKSLSRYETQFLKIIDKKVKLKERKQILLKYHLQVGKLLKAFSDIIVWQEK
jgi:hypothetical protein